MTIKKISLIVVLLGTLAGCRNNTPEEKLIIHVSDTCGMITNYVDRDDTIMMANTYLTSSQRRGASTSYPTDYSIVELMQDSIESLLEINNQLKTLIVGYELKERIYKDILDQYESKMREIEPILILPDIRNSAIYYDTIIFN